MQDTATVTEFIYERIARELTEQIQNGILQIGDRLPSVREICRREQVSPGSAMQAFALLEARGLVEAKPKSGFYVRARRIADASQPGPSRSSLDPTAVGVSDLVAQFYKEVHNTRLIPLGGNIPAPDFFPNEKLSRMLAAAVRERPELLGDYCVNQGLPEFTRQLALRLSSYGCQVPPNEIVVTYGATEALNLAIRAVARPGEIIAVETPCYFGVLEILESLGLKVALIPSTSEHGIHLDHLEKALQTHDIKALVLVTSFSNPNGACLPPAKRKALYELLKRYDTPLIEDDVYGDLHFGPDRPRPVKAHDREGLVMYCSSFSKSLAPGLRTGWIAAGRYQDRVARLKFINSIGTPAVTQLALAKYLQSGAYERHLRNMRRRFATQVSQTLEALLESFPEGTAVSQPQGGCSVWVQLPDHVNALDLHDYAIKEGISIAPGQLFCPAKDIQNRIRISCSHPVTDEVRRAIRKLGSKVKQLSSVQLIG
ncbi:PLP-dependent aminotransferase family protein [Coraliomargarita parva]|uniref:aminotransferase-like domain-containing protein n=1 Tax=Coraliomargarita parva TaxID=3014050 RepID=UPI0022B4AFAC|nr:PLP-dependent aminotransferase family protein [Coraliomargarita parva]